MRNLLTPVGKGYLVTLADYLVSACGPKEGFGARTSLFGLQRPPIGGGMPVLRIGEADSYDRDTVAIHASVFAMTNAREQFQLSLDSDKSVDSVLLDALKDIGVSVKHEIEAAFTQRVEVCSLATLS